MNPKGRGENAMKNRMFLKARCHEKYRNKRLQVVGLKSKLSRLIGIRTNGMNIYEELTLRGCQKLYIEILTAETEILRKIQNKVE